MSKSRTKSLPVLMYHYISDYPNSIAVPPEIFEEQCRTMAENGWKGVGLDEAEAYFLKGESLPAKSVLITFDDGYLDNYIYAQAILHKYGHKGVMCLVSGRMEKEEKVRAEIPELLAGRIPGRLSVPEIPSMNKPIQRNELSYEIRKDLFCNRAEVREMDRAGVIRVISHSQNHLGVYLGPEYTNLIKPGNQKRTFYHTHCPRPYGLPNFKVLGGLLHRAFIPNPELVDKIEALVPQEELAADLFFKNEGRLAELHALLLSYKNELGRYENEAERTKRMRKEIVEGKAELEEVLGYETQTLCWPWGMYSDEAVKIAREAGFKIFISTQEGSNPPARPDAVKRFKAKAQSGKWLLSRIKIYSRPLLGKLYAKIRI